MTNRYTVLDVIAVLLLLLGLVAVARADLHLGDTEARAYQSIVPDGSYQGLGIAQQFGTVERNWWLIGDFAPERKLFVDWITLDGHSAFGASFSMKKASEDDGYRGFGTLWRKGEIGITIGISKGWDLDFSKYFE